MGIIDYSKEPVSDTAFIDMKSFYLVLSVWSEGFTLLKPPSV